MKYMITFGPVPSRRLGRSLGINNIPPKVCTYSCVYCQVGRTIQMQIARRSFYEPEDIFKEVQEKLERARKIGECVDYLTFVPDGEPTLDLNLGREIELLKPLGIKIAVITNTSLMGSADVREEIMQADWVSLKVDTTQEETWHRINRPHRSLKSASIRGGMLEFAKAYTGELATETMLIKGINDRDSDAEDVGDFLAKLRPAKAYLAIPVRPPAEAWVQAPCEETVNRYYQILNKKIEHVEYLIGYEGNAFTFTGNVEKDLLSITAVHPMREEAVSKFLTKARTDWTVVHKLIVQGQLAETEYEGRKFYIRRFHGKV